jgi:putative endonuclease
MDPLSRRGGARYDRNRWERSVGGASIYVLLCRDGSYYTGVTRHAVDERVSEHTQGLMPGYTFMRRPLKLVFSEHYERIVDAIAAERRSKAGRGRRRRPTCSGISQRSWRFAKTDPKKGR